MVSPVVLPIPAAIAVLLILVAVSLLGAYLARPAETDLPLWPTTPKMRPTGRHRLTPAAAADPNRRDWAAVAAERYNSASPGPLRTIAVVLPLPDVFDPLDPRVPLAEVERVLADDTRELEQVA